MVPAVEVRRLGNFGSRVAIKGVVLLNCVYCQFGLSGSVCSVDYVELFQL